jgi:hypothetical protein
MKITINNYVLLLLAIAYITHSAVALLGAVIVILWESIS